MEHKTKPLLGSLILIFFGSLGVTCVTIYGINNNPGELIRNDVLLGPIIATGRIVIPLFFTLGLIYFLATIKKCQACGKIMFWKKRIHNS